jgi:hypothetical protein
MPFGRPSKSRRGNFPLTACDTLPRFRQLSIQPLVFEAGEIGLLFRFYTVRPPMRLRLSELVLVRAADSSPRNITSLDIGAHIGCPSRPIHPSPNRSVPINPSHAGGLNRPMSLHCRFCPSEGGSTRRRRKSRKAEQVPFRKGFQG